jgi:formylglycine-generating enzyme
MKRVFVFVVISFVSVIANRSSADNIQGIDIEFVNIGHAGNTADSTSYGAVGYDYRIGKYEVTSGQWDSFVSLAGTPIGNPSEAYDTDIPNIGTNFPVSGVSWYEAAQFCNYLTSGNKIRGAYLFSGDNINPGDFLGIDRASAISNYGNVYLIPTEDEWYKAAYYKPDGSGYSLYANGLDTIPPADNGWNYNVGEYKFAWTVGTGSQEQNGTYNMMGNLREWNETLDGSNRSIRGGACLGPTGLAQFLRSSGRYSLSPIDENQMTGFRIVSVPEPSTLLLLGFGGLLLRKRN